MDHLPELFHSWHDEDLLYVYLQMLQAWLVVAPPSKMYTLSTVLFHKYGEANVAVKNFMSHFSMFVPTKDNVKLANGNTGNEQGIGIIYVTFLTVRLYIHLDQLIIVSVNLPTLYHQVP